jgi:hypothetical protein
VFLSNNKHQNYFFAKFVIVVLEIFFHFCLFRNVKKKGPCSSERMVIGNTAYLLHVHRIFEIRRTHRTLGAENHEVEGNDTNEGRRVFLFY